MRKSLFATLLVLPILLISCTGEGSSSQPTSSDSPSSPTTSEIPTVPNDEVETYTDPVLNANINKMRDGFTMQGNVIQRRYASTINSDGEYEIDGDPIDTNTYYTMVGYNSKDENAFYKYSYRLANNVEIAAEGPYTYFEDENGYAYTESIDYSNKVSRNYQTYNASTNTGLTFADNGFYNFVYILLEEDFTLNESVQAFTRYDLNINKAAIISNNLLYSLNSGAFAVPNEAYFRVDNGNFTSLTIELDPITSIDSTTGEVTLITNSIVFAFNNLGEQTIEHITPYEETEASETLTNAFKTFEGQSFKMTVRHQYEGISLYPSDVSDLTVADDVTTDYYFTGKEIYVHTRQRNETSNINLERDYYLAPTSETDMHLYPYAYDSSTGEYTVRNAGVILEDGTIAFAQAYVGYYFYSDLLPIISDISGTFFDQVDETTFTVKEGMMESLADCFVISKRPFQVDRFEESDPLTINLSAGTVSTIEGEYDFTDTMQGYRYNGSISVEYSMLGDVTLEDIIG